MGGHRVLPPAGGCHKPASTLADSGRHHILAVATGFEPAQGHNILTLVLETSPPLRLRRTTIIVIDLPGSAPGFLPNQGSVLLLNYRSIIYQFWRTVWDSHPGLPT